MSNARPWSTLGINVASARGLFEAMTEAKVMFNVEVRNGYFVTGGNGEHLYKLAEGHFFIVREDTDMVLGFCKTKFRPLQNVEAFGFFKSLIKNGICKIDTIGTLGGGQKVWILAEIIGSRFSVVSEDNISLYLLLINAHDGSTSVTVGIVPVRIWCSNMFSMLNKDGFQVIKFKHTGKPADKLTQVTSLINNQLGIIEGFVGQLRKLTEEWPSPDNLDKYFRQVFGVKCKEEASTKINNKIDRLHALFIQGMGNQHPEIRGTWYAAYNAVSEYLNYEAGRSSETRLTSLWFGTNNNTNRTALQMALDQVGGV